MKRFFLFAFACLFALAGVSAWEGAADEAVSEPALIQQSLGQPFGVAELTVVLADPSRTDFGLFTPCPVVTGVNETGIGLDGLMTVNNAAGQTVFVNFSPGIIASKAEWFLSGP
jgi:hypothetical protein